MPLLKPRDDVERMALDYAKSYRLQLNDIRRNTKQIAPADARTLAAEINKVNDRITILERKAREGL